jgi:hypothetical protein
LARSAALLVALAMFSALAAPLRATAAPVGETGSPEALAFDASGNGWAWAAAAPQRPGTNYLLRIESNDWRIAADSTTNPVLLPAGLHIVKMVLSARGDSGWAAGYTDECEPVLWHFRDGAWRSVRLGISRSAYTPYSLTMNAAGTDGWLTFYDKGADRFTLLRLQQGSWSMVRQNPDAEIAVAAISPDGNAGLAWGRPADTAGAVPALYRLQNGSQPVKGPAIGEGQGKTDQQLAVGWTELVEEGSRDLVGIGQGAQDQADDGMHVVASRDPSGTSGITIRLLE